jgi:hypothetical protein
MPAPIPLLKGALMNVFMPAATACHRVFVAPRSTVSIDRDLSKVK